jgi:hypothetical protein
VTPLAASQSGLSSDGGDICDEISAAGAGISAADLLFLVRERPESLKTAKSLLSEAEGVGQSSSKNWEGRANPRHSSDQDLSEPKQ